MGKFRLDVDRLKLQAVASGLVYCVAYVSLDDTILFPFLDRVGDLFTDGVLVPATV